jgi:hypothetical protein
MEYNWITELVVALPGYEVAVADAAIGKFVVVLCKNEDCHSQQHRGNKEVAE